MATAAHTSGAPKQITTWIPAASTRLSRSLELLTVSFKFQQCTRHIPKPLQFLLAQGAFLPVFSNPGDFVQPWFSHGYFSSSASGRQVIWNGFYPSRAEGIFLRCRWTKKLLPRWLSQMRVTLMHQWSVEKNEENRSLKTGRYWTSFSDSRCDRISSGCSQRLRPSRWAHGVWLVVSNILIFLFYFSPGNVPTDYCRQ